MMNEDAQRKVDFNGLVASLAASTAAVLAQVELLLDPTTAAAAGVSEEEAKPLSADERRKRVSDGLAGVRQLIDTLVVLEEKTQGNLSVEEGQLLQSALSDLRIRYVSLANRPVPEVGQGEG
jgi:hypothetical protein